jgi:hypothetical protein
MALAPIVALKADAQAELTAEAGRLAAFLAPKAQEHRVRVIGGGWPAVRDLGIPELENER